MSVNPADFSVDEKPGEYHVCVEVSGTIRMTITADSLEDAQTKAFAMTEKDGFGTELDDVDEVNVASVRKSPPMYRVTRNGGVMQVSCLEDGDVPRQPNDRGF